MQDEEIHASVNARAIEKLRRDLGPVVMGALNDPKTVEVLLNADGGLWQERLGEKMRQIGTMTPQRAEAVVKTVAGYHGKTVTRLNPLQNGVFNSALVQYDAGGPGDIVLVQVFYQWPLVLGPLSFSLANTASGTRLMIGTAVFRNEPYA